MDVAHGNATEIVDQGELTHVQSLDLHAWHHGPKPFWIDRLRVTGRRLPKAWLPRSPTANADSLTMVTARPPRREPSRLWRFDSSMAGVLTIEAGHHLGRHAHRAHHHRI
jgi:hypothetical protein